MREQTRVHAGVAVAAVLGIDAAVHLYWTTGATWPAPDVPTLSRAVLGTDVPFTPRVLLPLAALLVAGATVMLASVGRAGPLGRHIPVPLVRLGTLTVALGALARGAIGLAWAAGVGVDTGSLFYRLNLLAYTPACLALFAATLTARRLTAQAGRSKAHRHAA